MADKEKVIAELVVLLPMFMRTLLEGSSIKTAARLNISEEKTLMYIQKHEGGTMTEYSKRVGLARGSFTTVADSLVKKGLIERISGVGDRRKYTLVLTKKGRTIAQDINSQFKQHIATRLACLAEEDLDNLKNALEIIATTIKKLNDRRN